MPTHHKPTGISATLLKQAVDGDENAFKSIYNLLSNTMYGICLRYSLYDDEANDMFQESFTTLYLNLSKFRNEGSFEGWAKSIVVRTCLDYVKARRPFIFELNNVPIKETNDLSGFDKLSMDELVKIIQLLPDMFRLIINLYCIEGYNHKEIAEMLGIAEGTSKSQLARAKSILKEKLLHKVEQRP